MKSWFRFDNHCLRRRVDNSLQTSPWLRITTGTLKKERSTSLIASYVATTVDVTVIHHRAQIFLYRFNKHGQ